MDSDYGIDFAAIFEVIDTAEVITFRFITIPQRLLFDARHTEVEGPLVRLVPRASSLEERFKAIKQLRPRFRLPDKITAIWWPRYVDSLVECGVWERILKRVRELGYPELADQFEETIKELIRKERAEILNAVTGAGYQSLWERAA
jgi:hypothetical protein